MANQFLLQQGEPLYPPIFEAKMMANLWPIILNSIKAMFYILKIDFCEASEAKSQNFQNLAQFFNLALILSIWSQLI